jgi:hypothetical protein
MSGLDISTGGRTSVDTDELREFAHFLNTLSGQLFDWHLDAVAAAGALDAVPAAARFDFARASLDSASSALGRASDQSGRVAVSAATAAETYATAEGFAHGLADWAGALASQAVAALAVRALPVLIAPAAVSLLPAVGPALVAAGLLWANPVTRRAVAGLGVQFGAWATSNARQVATPGAVSLVRAAVSVSDDVVAGATGLPRAVVGSGSAGLASSVLVGASSRLTETPVAVAATPRATPVAPPTTVADLAARIPPSAPGQPQIRIEEYTTADGTPSWTVYVAGTVEMHAGSSEEAFDIESAVGSMAGEDGAAYRAVREAMADAGIGAEDHVTLTGHSQGGLVAAAVAASGDYRVDSVVTFGAPSAQIPTLDGVTTVAVEHADDLVPALAGEPPAGDERIVVSRDTEARDREGDSLLDAHSLAEYGRTAELMDASGDRRMGELRSALEGIAPAGQAGSATDYRADRVAD